MIRHVVFFTAREEACREAVREGLSVLTAIPHGRTVVGRNLGLDALSPRVDFVVYGEFADEAELSAYKVHAFYQKSIEAVRPLRELRIAADFET
jgi:Stress responsive A/B Barrel Domain